MIYCGSDTFLGFAIIFDPETSIIEIKDKFGKEIISYSKSSKKRFMKVLRKVSKGVCPVCKRPADVGWIEDAKLVDQTNLCLFHSSMDGNDCPGDVVVRKIWADYAFEKKDICVYNVSADRKRFENFVVASTPKSQKAIMLYGKCRISPAAKKASTNG